MTSLMLQVRDRWAAYVTDAAGEGQVGCLQFLPPLLYIFFLKYKQPSSTISHSQNSQFTFFTDQKRANCTGWQPIFFPSLCQII